MFTAMASEQPNHQSADDASPVLDPRVIDSSTPLPSRCRTFRLSEIPPDMNDSALCQCLDSLQVGKGSIKGNSKVFSLATYRSWQVATVSFHQEPDEFERCKPGHEVHLQLPERQVETRAVPVRVTIDCDFYSMTPLYEPVGTTAGYE
jgi:hypothetical protein